jgi:hypothetical protein
MDMTCINRDSARDDGQLFLPKPGASGPADAKRASIGDGLDFDRFGHGEREPVLCSAMQVFQDGEITTAKS